MCHSGSTGRGQGERHQHRLPVHYEKIPAKKQQQQALSLSLSLSVSESLLQNPIHRRNSNGVARTAKFPRASACDSRLQLFANFVIGNGAHARPSPPDRLSRSLQFEVPFQVPGIYFQVPFQIPGLYFQVPGNLFRDPLISKSFSRFLHLEVPII